MENHEDACVTHSAGSIFLALEYPHEASMDQLNLLKPLQLHSKANVDHDFDDENLDVIGLQTAAQSQSPVLVDPIVNMQGGRFNTKLDGWQQYTGPPAYQGLNLNCGATLSIIGQHYDNQEYAGEGTVALDESTVGFDPICLLKLPVLAGLTDHKVSPSSMDRKFLPYHSSQQDYGLSLSSHYSSIQTDHHPFQEDYTRYSGTSCPTSHGAQELDERSLLHRFMVSYNENQSIKAIEVSNSMIGNRDGETAATLLKPEAYHHQVSLPLGSKGTGKRKRSRAAKNSEEIENQRMTHIAVERNRRRQMNEHLRVLKALMPPSYVQRGDQASIIGGAIEFVKELEQLLQCLESQKRRRIFAGKTNPSGMALGPTPVTAGNNMNLQMQVVPAMYNDSNNMTAIQENTIGHHDIIESNVSSCMTNALCMGYPEMQPYIHVRPSCSNSNNHNIPGSGGGLVHLHEDVAEARCRVADIEVKVVGGTDAIIKILSQRRPRQLLHTIAALQQDLHFRIFHTNVTTIDHTVLYSFTVKMHNESTSSAKDIAASVQQMFIHLIQTHILDQ